MWPTLSAVVVGVLAELGRRGGHTHSGQSTRITPGCNSAERARQVRSPPEVQDLGTGPALGSGDLGAGPALGSGCQASLHPSFCSVVAVLRGNLHQSLVFIKLCVKHSFRRDGSPRLPGSLRLKAGWRAGGGGWKGAHGLGTRADHPAERKWAAPQSAAIHPSGQAWV